MEGRDWNPIWFAGSTVVFILTILIWICFPQYRLLDMTIVYRPVWAPPQLTIATGMDRLTDDDLQKLKASPEVIQQIKTMREAKRPFSANPNWLGYDKVRSPNEPIRTGRRYPTNPLLYLAVGTGVLYFGLLKYRGII